MSPAHCHGGEKGLHFHGGAKVIWKMLVDGVPRCIGLWTVGELKEVDIRASGPPIKAKTVHGSDGLE